MDKDTERIKSFTRRAFLLGALQGGLLTVLGGRLAWLQIAEGQRYKTLSDKNRINIKMVAPSRGLIVDRYGTPLAQNGQNFRVLLIPEQAGNVEQALAALQEYVDISTRDVERALHRATNDAPFVPIEVKDTLSWEEVARVEVNLPDLPGLEIDVGEIRTYPLGAATAHLVGYVGPVSKAELTGDPVLSLPGFRLGKTGVEKHYDKKMRGAAGTSEVEVNVVGREVRELRRNPGREGARVQLTVDARLQSYMQERLSAEKSASAVMMDIFTGAVYALASAPSFDPNLLTRGISAEKWEELLADPGLPLNNKAVGGQYPPGSTFKMITALAALEEGVVNSNSRFYCPGHYEYGDDRFHCWKWSGHGRMDLVDALAESCDTYFYNIATEIGINNLARYAEMMGLGHRLGFELGEERPGLMPTREWKMGHFGQHWKPGETIVASIGQGYIQATPLQLATMTARLVNGGYAVKPWITGFVGDEAGPDQTWPKIDVKKRHLDLIIKGMNRATTHPDGTAVASQIKERDKRFGGKTGTSQVRRITMEDRLEGIENRDLPWRLRHHSLFVGYAPLHAPRYACAVVVEHGGSGSVTAAPIASDLLLKVQELDPASKPLKRQDGEAQMLKPRQKPMKKRQTQREG